MLVINVLAIVFSIAYGITAYLLKRRCIVATQSRSEKSSLNDYIFHRLLLLSAFYFQWFVVGFPFAILIEYVEISWIASLFDIIGICSALLTLGAVCFFLFDTQLRESNKFFRCTDYVLKSISIAFAVLMIAVLMIAVLMIAVLI